LESKKANREGSTLRAGILDAVCAKVPLQHQVQVQKATFEIHSLVPTTSQATKEAAREEAEEATPVWFLHLPRPDLPGSTTGETQLANLNGIS